MGKAARNFYLAAFYLFGTAAHSHTQVHAHSLHGQQDSCAIDPKSIVSDACASYSTLDALNVKLQPHIRALTQHSDFFSYYRLDLFSKTCPFWSDENGMCGNIACAVTTIDDEEQVPPVWRARELGKLEGPKAQHPDRQLQQRPKPLQGELGDDVAEACVVEFDDDDGESDYCVPDDDASSGTGDYVSLLDNPERFTGFGGEGAHQVWSAIYRENCFTTPAPFTPYANGDAAHELRQVLRSPSNTLGLQQPLPAQDELDFEGECLEKRVFYRVLSGMHASITTLLCWDYLNQSTGQWGPNLQCFEQRLHHHPDWISNLYFNYALLSRAVAKVENTLKRYTFCAGDPEQDKLTKTRVLKLARAISASANIYDESLMFQDNRLIIKEDFRSRFRNVSRTMDCVGCDKCRLWGKLQVAGYGTALKILFDFDENDVAKNPPLRRTELVALINTLDKISSSMTYLAKFAEMLGPEHRAATVPFSSAGSAATQEAVGDPLLKADTHRKGAGDSEDLNVEDDGLDEDPPKPPRPGFWEVVADEVGVVLFTAKWVLIQWKNLPVEMFWSSVYEIRRLVHFWLGFYVEPRHYDTRYPPARDEI